MGKQKQSAKGHQNILCWKLPQFPTIFLELLMRAMDQMMPLQLAGAHTCPVRDAAHRLCVASALAETTPVNTCSSNGTRDTENAQVPRLQALL